MLNLSNRAYWKPAKLSLELFVIFFLISEFLFEICSNDLVLDEHIKFMKVDIEESHWDCCRPEGSNLLQAAHRRPFLSPALVGWLL
jgi:hypothetical protein